MAPHDLLLRIARMHFEAGMTNDEIAAQLLADRTLKTCNGKTVGRHVNEAAQWLLDYYENFEEDRTNAEIDELEDKLCERYGLKDVRLVSGGDTHGAMEFAALMRRWGNRAAEYFDQVSSDAEERKDDLHVAVSGGQTILDMMRRLPNRRRTTTWFYGAALIPRGAGNSTSHVGPETNASIGWSLSGRIPERLFYGTVSPPSFTERELRTGPMEDRHAWFSSQIVGETNAHLSDEVMREVLGKQFGKINMAIAGLGLITPGPQDERYGQSHVEKITMTSLLTPLGVDPARLARDGAVGEISYCMFDKEGRGRPEWNYFLTAGAGTAHPGVGFYRNLVRQGCRVVIIAGGKKWLALKSAIDAGLFNVLISDVFTARKLLGA